jgi:hypothetical protein
MPPAPVYCADYPELKIIAPGRLDYKEILTPNKKGGFKNRKSKVNLPAACRGEIHFDGRKLF